MIAASWSQLDGDECIRATGVDPGADVVVRAGAGGDAYPGMAGRVVHDADSVCFVPSFAFVAGTRYSVSVDGAVVAWLERARPVHRPTAEVTAIEPTARVVPRNLLRFAVTFSVPMAEGSAADHVRLVDDDGVALVGALLPNERELWDPTHHRLTVLLDPARIKRGLAPHREVGYPLRPDSFVQLVVDVDFVDASGAPLRSGGERRYAVGDDERRRVDPFAWAMMSPTVGRLDPLVVTFDRPLDRGLSATCLQVIDATGRPVVGTISIEDGDRSWRLTPAVPWAPARHHLVVDPGLEDLAGNSVRRVFDRDLDRPEDAPVGDVAVVRPFVPRGPS